MNIRPVTYLDYYKLVNLDLRPKDKNEVFALSGKTPEEAIKASTALSPEVYVIEESKEGIKGVYGISETFINDLNKQVSIGVPWMLTEKEFSNSSITFFRTVKRHIDKWNSEYTMLMNYVDSRREDDFKFLKMLGFDIITDEPRYFYLDDVRFYPFARI